jgi:hypothetical protein
MRTRVRYVLATAVLAGVALAGTVVSLPAQGNSDVQIGAAIAPVTLNMKGLNPALVRKGSYIVNAQGGCNDCHTFPPYTPTGNPFAGQPEEINAACYLAGGAPFGDVLRSRNLTPRANGLPAGRTLEQFKTILRTGRYPNGQILQVMPWPVYGKMSDNDLEAIYEFLSAIPSVPNNPRPPGCPVPPPPA